MNREEMTGPGTGPTVCTDHHLAYLLAAAMHLAGGENPRGYQDFRWETYLLEEMVLTPETIRWTGQMLRDTNEESVRGWTGGPLPEYRPFRVTGFRTREDMDFSPVETIRAARHYADQAVHSPGWTRSHAACFIKALTEAAIRRLPGYAEAPPEGPPSADIFTRTEREEH